VRPLLDATIDLVVASAAAIVCSAALAFSGYAWAIVSPMAALIIARQLRALECLLHEGSHLNWSRRDRILNDRLSILLSGIPTGSSIADYRESHWLHHGWFGSTRDPDWLRYQELSVEDINRSTWIHFAKDLSLRLFHYQLGWLRSSSASIPQIVAASLWPLVVLLIPMLLLFKNGLAALGAIATWQIAYFVVLPVVRIIGEINEHSFRDSRTVIDATISNLGLIQRWLFHPHNDGYHTVHHLWPGVPYYNLPRLHNKLVVCDVQNYGTRVRFRRGIRDNPSRLTTNQTD
jgi:fatty acid desaturase